MNFTLSKLNPRKSRADQDEVSAQEQPLLSADALQQLISHERKRSERSGKPFLLMLVECRGTPSPERDSQLFRAVAQALVCCVRETDCVGWYRGNSTIGVIFTELAGGDHAHSARVIETKVYASLANRLSLGQINRIHLSFYLYPEDRGDRPAAQPVSEELYPDLNLRAKGQLLQRFMKRGIDFTGSLVLLVLCLPVFLILAALIKVTSRGPVIFRQRRIGQYGTPFTFLKFRSMYVNNDESTHKEFVRNLIARGAGDGQREGVYKITRDPRVTPIGRFIRQTSLDELPQLLNVLAGDMSLVGPRPAIAYEVDAYKPWHRNRVIEAKPGITGLWQVNGRSRVSFDEMVRLDLRYARSWSPWLDLKILLHTPRAVLLGDGAY